MNWIQIDKHILSLIGIVKDKETLIKEVRSKFKWTEKQALDACNPLIRRSSAEDKWTKAPVKKKKQNGKKKQLSKK
jgi:hypothetical protein